MYMQEDVPPVYKVRDVVNVINDKDKVSRLQKGHGDWLDEMAEVQCPRNVQELYVYTVWMCIWAAGNEYLCFPPG